MKSEEITPEETLEYAIEQLDDARFAFAAFVDAFKRYMDERGLNKDD